MMDISSLSTALNFKMTSKTSENFSAPDSENFTEIDQNPKNLETGISQDDNFTNLTAPTAIPTNLAFENLESTPNNLKSTESNEP